MVLLPNARGTVAGVPEVIAPLFDPTAHEAVPDEKVAVKPVDVTEGNTPVALKMYTWPFASVIVEFDNSIEEIGPVVAKGAALATLAVAYGTVKRPTTMAADIRTRENSGLENRIVLRITQYWQVVAQHYNSSFATRPESVGNAT